MVSAINAPAMSRPKHSVIVISDGEIGFTLGNSKLPYTTAIWNIPALVTCPGAAAQGCGWFEGAKKRGPCYAFKAERMRPGVVESRSRNLKASLEPGFRERLWLLILQVVNFRKIKVDKIRPHEAGDFYSQAYLDTWVEMAWRLYRKRRALGRTVKVYCYTKSVDLDFSKRPPNMIVLLSDDRHIWKDQWHRFDGVFGIENPEATLRCIEDCTQCTACADRKHFHIAVRKH